MGVLKAGLSEVVITPPVGVRLSGYEARTQQSIGILDDLYAKALVLDNEKETLALVVCDLIELENDTVNDIRRRIRKLTEIKEDHVMISATHTHTGPDLRFTGRGYIENLKSQIAGAVYAACSKMRDARIGLARGECLVGMNRRNPRSPYGPYFLYSWPEGPMDPTVLVLRIEDISRRVMGVLVNYACHAVTLGPKELMISRDYPGHALRVLEHAWGRDTVAIFMNGCCANINPGWIWDRPQLSPPPFRVFPESLAERLRETKRLGHILGGESLKAAESITNLVSDLDLRAGKKLVDLPLRDRIPETLLQYRTNLRGRKSITTEVQVFSFGQNLIIGLPGEVFVEYQLELREKSKAPFAFVSELANDSIDYIPTLEAYEQGGYEPDWAYVAPGAGKILTNEVLGIIERLR